MVILQAFTRIRQVGWLQFPRVLPRWRTRCKLECLRRFLAAAQPLLALLTFGSRQLCACRSTCAKPITAPRISIANSPFSTISRACFAKKGLHCQLLPTARSRQIFIISLNFIHIFKNIPPINLRTNSK